MKSDFLKFVGFSIKPFLILTASTFIIPAARAQENVFPNGINIDPTYSISSIDFSVNDTIIITRTLTNNESYDLHNLFLSETLPSEFILLSSTISINDSTVSSYHSGPQRNHTMRGYDTFRWAIDLPVQDDSLNNLLAPDDVLALQYRLSCSTQGVYVFPFHSLCCYGNNTGIFTVSDSFAVTVSPGSYVGGNEISKPRRPGLSFGYPNPFNGEIIIRFDGAKEIGATIELKIFDCLGREIYRDEISATEGYQYFRWRPEKDVASGIYFYNLSYNNLNTRGRITFLR